MCKKGKRFWGRDLLCGIGLKRRPLARGPSGGGAARSRPARQPNRRQGTLLFPVITITGISDVNDINDLAICECISMRETLHLVVCTTQTARRDASGPAVWRPVMAVGRREFPGFSAFGTGREGRSHFRHILNPFSHKRVRIAILSRMPYFVGIYNVRSFDILLAMMFCDEVAHRFLHLRIGGTFLRC